MKNSINPTGKSNASLRLTVLALAAIFAGSMATGCGPQAMPAPQAGPGPQALPGQPAPLSPQTQQNSSLVGQWRTVIQSGTITISIQASGQYMQTGVPQNGGTQTAQGGPYTLTAPNTIAFEVTDWSPKTRWIFVPNPRCGVPGVPNPTNPRRDSCNQEQEWTMPQPPGSRYAYTFNGPNTVTLNNETAQETLTLTRVAGQ
jgi:hypothetical protein